MVRNMLIDEIEGFVKSKTGAFDGGHDWWHIHRVRNLSLHICSKEGKGDPLTVELSALLHDIGDSKFRRDGDKSHLAEIKQLLSACGIGQDVIDKVIFINENISFSSGGRNTEQSPEFMAVQDADRLDAIGAIGVARAFNYGGYRNNRIYDPGGEEPSTIAHFYDKLLRLRDLMNTTTGKALAAERHSFLESFLVQFYKEWKTSDDGEL